jgi:hypothetical protein
MAGVFNPLRSNVMKTEFEKKHWQQALLEIPSGAKLISINPTNCRVEKIGIFYKLPTEKGNDYMTAMTQAGKYQAEMLQSSSRIEHSLRTRVR